MQVNPDFDKNYKMHINQYSKRLGNYVKDKQKDQKNPFQRDFTPSLTQYIPKEQKQSQGYL